MALLEKSSEGRVTAATAMNKVRKHDAIVALSLIISLLSWSSTYSTFFLAQIALIWKRKRLKYFPSQVSSRSHAIFTLTMESKPGPSAVNQNITISKFHLVRPVEKLKQVNHLRS